MSFGLPSGGGLPNIGMGNLIGATQPPAPVQFLQGLAALPQAFEQGLADASQAAEARMQMQGMRMSIAQGQWDQNVAMIQKNPNLGNANNPLGAQMIQNMQQKAQILGFQLPLDTQGNIDKSVWGLSFTDTMKDTDFQKRWWSSTEQQRHAMADAMNLTGIPKDAFTVQPVLTAQEQEVLSRVGLHTEQESNLADIIKNRDLYTAAKDNNLSALSAEDHAAAVRDLDQGQAAISRANEAWASLRQRLVELKMKLSNNITVATIRAKTAPGSASMTAYRSQLADAQKMVSDARQDYNNLKKEIYTAIQNGGINDPAVVDLQKQLPEAQKNIDAAESKLQGEQAGVQAAIDAGYGRTVTGQAGAHSATVTTPKSHSGPPPGAPSSTGPKGTVWYYNGAWHDQNGNVVQ